MRTTRQRTQIDYGDAVLPRAALALAQRRAGQSIRPRDAFHACGPVEWLTLGYLALASTVIVVFGAELRSAPWLLLAHAATVAGVVTLCAAAERWPKPGLRFARHWYPLSLFIGLFEELQSLVHLIIPHWQDRWLIAFDYALLGAHPTVWLEQFSSPLLNDTMQAAYISYYFYPVVLGGVLYAREETRSLRIFMTATAAAYYISYVIAILFPIEGPYHTLGALQRVPELHGGFFTALIGVVERFGRVHGAAFPSLHVAGATVAVLAAWRFQRRLFWWFLPFFGAMLVSTVYGRYHYVADLLAGLVVGAMGYVAAELLEAKEEIPQGASVL